MWCRQKGKSPWAGADKSSNASSGAQAAAKLSDAAKAAAKRAAKFAKQRQERAYQLAQEQQPTDDSTSYLNSTQRRSKQETLPESRRSLRPSAAAAAAADGAAAGEYDSLRPYVEVVKDHMAQQQDSANSQGRGRGARKEAARTLLEAHTGIFQAALDLELQQEWQEAEERLKVC